ncbi:hypothetical protein QE152_g22142 [Popillia japonica]|uniref:Uncharacterized protein n=1 Tax=Popillia japonica TaxID=7064 RepID=A0AAW1KLV0_POPJA
MSGAGPKGASVAIPKLRMFPASTDAGPKGASVAIPKLRMFPASTDDGRYVEEYRVRSNVGGFRTYYISTIYSEKTDSGEKGDAGDDDHDEGGGGGGDAENGPIGRNEFAEMDAGEAITRGR